VAWGTAKACYVVVSIELSNDLVVIHLLYDFVRNSVLLIFILKTISTNTVWWELHKSNVHGTAVVAKPLTTDNSTHRWKRWSHPLHCYQHQAGFIFGHHPRKPIILNAWFQLWNMEPDLWFRQQHQVFCWSCTYSEWSNYCQCLRGHFRAPGASHGSGVVSQQLQFYKMMIRHTHSQKGSVLVWGAWRCTTTSSLASTIAQLKYNQISVVSFWEQGKKHLSGGQKKGGTAFH
jgi:hypothetical protein